MRTAGRLLPGLSVRYTAELSFNARARRASFHERPSRTCRRQADVLSRFNYRLCEALWQSLKSQLVIVNQAEEIGGEGGALEDLTDAINFILSPPLRAQARRCTSGLLTE